MAVVNSSVPPTTDIMYGCFIVIVHCRDATTGRLGLYCCPSRRLVLYNRISRPQLSEEEYKNTGESSRQETIVCVGTFAPWWTKGCARVDDKTSGH